MRPRLVKTLCPPAVRLAGAVMLCGALPVSGQQAPNGPNAPPVSPAQFDPSDIYFQGFLLTRSAEELEAKQDYIGAAEKLKTARELFNAIRKNYPGWKTDMVETRSTKTSEAESKIFELAKKQREEKNNIVAELEGGQKAPGKTIDPSEGVNPLTPPGILEVNPLETRRVEEAEAEVKRLKNLMRNNSSMGNAEESRNVSRLGDVTRQRDALQSQLNAAEANVQSLRARLAASPVEGEMKSLNSRIAGLEQEREAMAQALQQSRAEKTDVMARNAILEADLKVMQQRYADLDRDVKKERSVANEVVKSLRAQMEVLDKQLEEKTTALGKANERINKLEDQLRESAESFAQLKEETKSLQQERAQMSALLKLDKDGRIEDLIQQNMGLAKTLREANERVEILNQDGNATKDELANAKNDLTIAKNQINNMHRERREQDVRLADLERRLKGEEAALARGGVTADPGEVLLLRDIIQRQLRVQERRRQARDLLVEAAKDMGSKDERLAQAVKLFDGEELQLTADEQKLIAGRDVDAELYAPTALNRTADGRSTDALKQDIAVLDRTAEKSFVSGRYLPTRELFEMILEQKPNDISALCKLGIVNLKLEDPTAAVDTFRRAVEMDSSNPYAHRMLGFSFMTLGDVKSAEQSVKEAVNLAPDDHKGQLLLAIIYHRQGRLGEAESCYKAAISADPMPSDPYYNLARLSLKGKRPEEAKNYYSQALEHGALPDPALEELLQKQ